MERNGSSEPIFDTDDDRSYFFVELPIHSAFLGEKIVVKHDESVESNDRDNDRDKFELTNIQRIILSFARIPKSREEILNHIGLKYHSDNYKRHIEPLISKGLLKMTVPDKPNSKNQKYMTIG